MILGLSSYSLDPAIASGEMTLYDAIDWAAAQGAECMELVPFSFTFMDDERHIDSEYIKKVVRHAKDAGIKLCNYSVLADLCKEDPDALRDEVARVKRHVDVAAELGVPVMRHDVSAFRRPHGENGLEYFEKLLPLMVESAGAIADHAAQYGITTLIENHGFFANGCDRVERIIRAVNRPNYGRGSGRRRPASGEQGKDDSPEGLLHPQARSGRFNAVRLRRPLVPLDGGSLPARFDTGSGRSGYVGDSGRNQTRGL